MFKNVSGLKINLSKCKAVWIGKNRFLNVKLCEDCKLIWTNKFRLLGVDFDSNLEIHGMVSGEKEIVPFINVINPAKAKGMVEKWLVEVEQAMLSNVKRVCGEGTVAYGQTLRRKWVLEWPSG